MITLVKKASESWLKKKNMKVTLVCLGKNMTMGKKVSRSSTPEGGTVLTT